MRLDAKQIKIIIDLVKYLRQVLKCCYKNLYRIAHRHSSSIEDLTIHYINDLVRAQTRESYFREQGRKGECCIL